MLEKIKEWDTELFLFLNRQHTPIMDTAMYWITDRWFWFPLYGVIFFFVLRKLKWQGVWIILAVVAAVVLADGIVSGGFKPYFERNRPCYESTIKQLIHIVRGCDGQYGFASAHAATTFAFAMSMWLLLRTIYPYIFYLFFWACLVSYSRIYVGVHYPLDLLIGALVGIFCALVVYQMYKQLINLKNNKITPEKLN